MALPNNPTQSEVVKAIKDIENNMPTQITSIDGLAGGQLTSALYLAGGDAVSGAANIQLDTNGQITAKGTTSTLFGRNGSTALLVGHSSHELTLRGSATRPTYNGKALALSSDIPSEVTESTVSGWGFTKNAGTITKVQLNGTDVASSGTANVQALPNFSLNISHQTQGNPRPVKFLTVNYTSAATYFKMSATSCHDNGTSYQFLEDIIIGCTTSGTVVCNVYKYCQQAVSYDGTTRNYGDVFYVIDTTNKKVDFFILCGQWASSQFTPATKIGNTTIAYITQYTGTATYYSSGTKVWADGDSALYVRTGDLKTVNGNSLIGSGDLTVSADLSTCLKNNVNGTIVGSSSDTALFLQSKSTGSFIGFKNSSGTTLGYLGVNSSKKPIFYDTADRELALKSDIPSTSGLMPKSGGTFTGDVDWSGSSQWLKPYLLAFKNADTSSSPTYPYTGFYQWGAEWQVNARDASNTFVHNLLTINNSTKAAAFTGSVSAPSFYATSDRRLKENIKPAELDCGKVIDDLQIKEFNFIDDKDKKVVVGAIAQELQEILPEKYRAELIGGSEETQYTINEGKLLFVAIGALKEERAKTKELEERLAKLEKMLEV